MLHTVGGKGKDHLNHIIGAVHTISGQIRLPQGSIVDRVNLRDPWLLDPSRGFPRDP